MAFDQSASAAPLCHTVPLPHSYREAHVCTPCDPNTGAFSDRNAKSQPLADLTYHACV